MFKLNWTDIAWLVFFVTSPSICNSHSLHACVCAYVYSTNSTWLVTCRHDSTRSTCRAHAFWLCWACRTALLDMLDTMNSTGSTRWTCQVVSRRDMTSQVEFFAYLRIIMNGLSTMTLTTFCVPVFSFGQSVSLRRSTLSLARSARVQVGRTRSSCPLCHLFPARVQLDVRPLAGALTCPSHLPVSKPFVLHW